MTDNRTGSGAGAALPHESAHLHVSGEADYVDDQPEPRGLLYAAIGYSARAHARIRHMDFSAVHAAPGVVEVISAEDIPGANNHGPILADDPVFADGLVEYVGQSVFAVLADSVLNARKAARRARICLLYTSPSPRDRTRSRMPSSA